MRHWREGLISLAASAAFFVIQEMLFPLVPLYKWAGSLAVFVVAALLVHVLSRRGAVETPAAGGSLSGNEAGEDLNADIEDSRIAPGGETLSRNKARRDLTIRIKNSDIG